MSLEEWRNYWNSGTAPERAGKRKALSVPVHLGVRARPHGWPPRQVSDRHTHTYTQHPVHGVRCHQKEQTSRLLSNWGGWKSTMDAVPRSTPSPVSSVCNQHQRQPTYSSLLATITGSAVNSSTEQILTERVLCTAVGRERLHKSKQTRRWPHGSYTGVRRRRYR